MKKNIQTNLLNLVRIILLITACLATAFAIVWPLWKLSTKFSKAYTVIILTLTIAFLIYFIVMKIRKSSLIKTIQFVINLIMIAAAIVLSVYFTLNLKRIIALITFICFVILEIILNNIFSKKFHD